MAVRSITKIEPINRTVLLAIREGEPPEERARYLAAAARENLREAQEINRRATGSVPPHETYVDGRLGAKEESVKPDGVIIYEFEIVDEMYTWIRTQLVEHAPKRSGRFSESFVILADGVAIDDDARVPVDADEVVFLNTQPYARKIERGLSKQAPDGVMEVVASIASRRFGNVARIRFGYRTPLFGAINSWANTPQAAAWARQHGRRRDVAEWLRRQPAIVITR